MSATSAISRWEHLHPHLQRSLEELLKCPPLVDKTLLPRQPGIYLFTEAGKHMYVGRTRGLYGRIRIHSNPTATTEKAAFALRLARASFKQEFGDLPGRPYPENAAFQRHFSAAKRRIAAMEVRYVVTPESHKDALQAVLEIYVALELDAEHSDFKTH